MSVLPILLQGEPVLRQVAAPVGEITDTIRQLAANMTDTIYAAPGRGLAAPQVGHALRLFVIDAYWKDGVARAPRVMIDPRILWRSDDKATREEGCLSIPDLPVAVTRPATIAIAWTDLDGTRRQERVTGIEAVCVQHEQDHLDGILITDRLDPAARYRKAAALAKLTGGSWTPVA